MEFSWPIRGVDGREAEGGLLQTDSSSLLPGNKDELGNPGLRGREPREQAFPSLSPQGLVLAAGKVETFNKTG